MSNWKIVETHVLPLGWAGHIKIHSSESGKAFTAQLCLSEMSPITVFAAQRATLEICKERALERAKRALLDIQESIELELEAVDKLLAESKAGAKNS